MYLPTDDPRTKASPSRTCSSDACGGLRLRIINYEYHQAEQICSIDSGSVESAVKQVDRRTKISGAQWKQENVPQVLAHRCAYLNGLLSI